MKKFLHETNIIDYSNPKIQSLAKSLANNCSSEIEIAKNCFLYVRDKVRHTGDEKDNSKTTYIASDVLEQGVGWCYAKSHLLAALLRANNIPTGFCYQRLSCSEYQKDIYCLHGLNAIYLKDYGWHRVDARGNKEGVDAQFDPPKEKLAFDLQEDEFNLPQIYENPLEVVVSALQEHTSYDAMINNFPDIKQQTDKVFDPVKYKKMVKTFQENDDPLGWFNSIYTDASGDHRNVFWADLEPSPYLLQWLKNRTVTNKKAIVIGCGVGDDAEALCEAGYQVTAFDIAPEAIKLCKQRYSNTKVNYLVADLFEYPAKWRESYDLVYECNTIQVLPGKYRIKARDAMVSLLSPNASILVSCRSRNTNEQEDAIPLPLDKIEMDGFISCGLSEISFLAYDDTQTPSVPHFFAEYKRR